MLELSNEDEIVIVKKQSRGNTNVEQTDVETELKDLVERTLDRTKQRAKSSDSPGAKKAFIKMEKNTEVV